MPQSTPLSISRIRDRLARHRAGQLEDSASLRHAAVAMILRENGDVGGQEILIIRRAEHPADPWSGHLGFPGGRMEPDDPTPERAAVRETAEELGIALDSCATLLGRLSELRARSLSRQLPLSIFPFVYALREPAALQCNGEVTETRWVPLSHFLNRANRSTMPYPRDPRFTVPCYPLGDRFFWGMSLAMLDELLFTALDGEISPSVSASA